MSVAELTEYHRQRLEPVMGDARINLLCFETVPCLREARAIVHLLCNTPQLAGVHAWVSMSCRDGEHTCAGDKFADEVVPVLCACPQVVGIGVNCTAPRHVPSLLAAAKAKIEEVMGKPGAVGGHGMSRSQPRAVAPVLLTYPNSGELPAPYDVAGIKPGILSMDSYFVVQALKVGWTPP